MPKPRLTPEEREARRKERARFSFSDAAYRHYDPVTEGYGSPEEWQDTIERLASGLGKVVHRDLKVSADLVIMGLEELPGDIAWLKSAFRKQTFICHPDQGGTNEKFRELMAAFERLCKAYKK